MRRKESRVRGDVPVVSQVSFGKLASLQRVCRRHMHPEPDFPHCRPMCFSPTVFRVSSLTLSASLLRASTCGPWWRPSSSCPAASVTSSSCSSACGGPAPPWRCQTSPRPCTASPCCSTPCGRRGSASATGNGPRAGPAPAAPQLLRETRAHSGDRRRPSVSHHPRAACALAAASCSPEGTCQSLLWPLQPGLSPRTCSPDIYLHCYLPPTVQLNTPQLLVYLSPLLLSLSLFFFFFGKIMVVWGKIRYRLCLNLKISNLFSSC